NRLRTLGPVRGVEARAARVLALAAPGARATRRRGAHDHARLRRDGRVSAERSPLASALAVARDGPGARRRGDRAGGRGSPAGSDGAVVPVPVRRGGTRDGPWARPQGGAADAEAAAMSVVRRIAVVSGASTGIGEATARALAGDGWRCILLARRRE